MLVHQKIKKGLLALGLIGMSAAAWAHPYDIDPDHTFVNFEISHQNTSTIRVRLDDVTGKIDLDEKKKTADVNVLMKANSLSSGSKGFDAHLKNADLFNAPKFPELTFKSTKVNFDKDKITSVEGQLTLLGKTNPVVLKATRYNCYDNKRSNKKVCGGDFETIMDRTLWGLDYGVNWGFDKNIRILVQIEAAKR